VWPIRLRDDQRRGVSGGHALPWPFLNRVWATGRLTVDKKRPDPMCGRLECKERFADLHLAPLEATPPSDGDDARTRA